MRPKLHHIRYLITSFTQPLRLQAPFDEISDFDHRFRGILRRHLAILAWWSILNLGLGLVALVFFEGILYYFLMMGLVWGIVNMLVAMLIFYHAVFKKFKKGNAFERFEAQRHVEKILLLNIGLDFAYCFMGLLLREHGFLQGQKTPELWIGMGWSVVVQGLFLLLQDSWVYRLHMTNFRKAAPFLKATLRNGETGTKSEL